MKDELPYFDSDSPTILVADDSPTALKVTSSVLIKQGYKLILVSDGEQAIQQTLQQKPSACVIDLKMPKKDGFEVCREIKKQKDLFIPILLLTAREDIESLVQGLESGADDYIIKPFIEMEFIARIGVLLRLKKLNEELMHANRRLEYLSIHDELTDLYNHRFFIQTLEQLMVQSKKEKSNLCLGIFDLDHFKKVNDTHGHLEGDRVLKLLAEHLISSFTSDTILARYGGEEFTALFPKRSMDFAISACQCAIDDFAKTVLRSGNSSYRITVSAGVTSTDAIKSYTPSDLIQEADRLLYQSKNAGRNKLSF